MACHRLTFSCSRPALRAPSFVHAKSQVLIPWRLQKVTTNLRCKKLFRVFLHFPSAALKAFNSLFGNLCVISPSSYEILQIRSYHVIPLIWCKHPKLATCTAESSACVRSPFILRWCATHSLGGAWYSTTLNDTAFTFTRKQQTQKEYESKITILQITVIHEAFSCRGPSHFRAAIAKDRMHLF